MSRSMNLLGMAALILAAGVHPSFAGKTKAELEAAGYTCGRIGVGGYSCTKPGEKEQLCDNDGKCESLLVQGGGGKKHLNLNLNATTKMLKKSANPD
jgi:hypothetical protein